MARIDEVKEELSYLKVWLGVLVITAISLMSWLINNYETNSIKVFADIIAIIFITILLIVIDKKIKKKIKSLRDIS